MVRRKILNGVAAGLASSFVSRNNDIDGSWGMGKLYLVAASGDDGSRTVVLDLIAPDALPSHDTCLEAAAT